MTEPALRQGGSKYSTVRDPFHVITVTEENFAPAMGHDFNEHMVCNCGIGWNVHQDKPATCTLVREAVGRWLTNPVKEELKTWARMVQGKVELAERRVDSKKLADARLQNRRGRLQEEVKRLDHLVDNTRHTRDTLRREIVALRIEGRIEKHKLSGYQMLIKAIDKRPPPSTVRSLRVEWGKR